MAVRALVVGGTSGIGYAMACRIAADAKASSVIVSGRTKPKTVPFANMEFRPLDATSMRQIKQYTDSFKATQTEKLDFLIMTQGTLNLLPRTETPEGIDRKMALHYYSKQLLIRELLPALKDDAKVIIVYDGKAGSPEKLLWDDLDLKTHFSLGKAADHCISMNDAMVQYFASPKQQESNKRHFIHAWPGAVNTNVSKELPLYLKPVARVVYPLISVSPDKCAEYLLSGAAKYSAEGNNQGRLWINLEKGRLAPNKAIWTEDQMRNVADHTWGLIDNAIATP